MPPPVLLGPQSSPPANEDPPDGDEAPGGLRKKHCQEPPRTLPLSWHVKKPWANSHTLWTTEAVLSPL